MENKDLPKKNKYMPIIDKEFIVAKPVLLEYRALIGQIYFTIVEGAENEDYSKQGTYQKTNSLEDLKKSWTPESILPPEKLKI